MRRAAVFEAAQISICPRLLQNWLPRPKFTKFQWVEWLITAQLAICRGAYRAACQIRAAKGKTGYQPYPVQRTIRLYRTADRLCSRIIDFGQKLRAGMPQGANRKRTAQARRSPHRGTSHGDDAQMRKPISSRSPRRLLWARRRAGPAGTRRLDGCTKGRDARRSQTARRTASTTGISRSGPHSGCVSGSAGCPRPFITETVRRRAAP